MKVTDVKVIILKKKLNRSMQISRGGFRERVHAIVKVETDSGLYGLGEGIGNPLMVKSIIESQLKEKLIGRDPFQIELNRKNLTQDFVYFERMGSAICAVSALETALFDIKGKALNVPVYELLGGKTKPSLEMYASDIYWEENIDDMIRACQVILDKGINAVKAHLGFGSPEEDLKRVKAIREVCGPEVKFMVDLNCGYTPLQAMKAIELWKEYDLHWLEEPLGPEYFNYLPELVKNSSIPIALGENEYTVFGFKKLFDEKGLHVAMPDIGRAGGIAETKNITSLANTYGIEVSPHNFSSGVLLSATAHLLHSEHYASFLEYDLSDNAVYLEFFKQRPEIVNGRFSLSDEPGLGVELKEDILKDFEVVG